MKYTLFYDDCNDPTNPGWVTESRDEDGNCNSGMLDAADPNNPDAALREAADHWGVDPAIIIIGERA